MLSVRFSSRVNWISHKHNRRPSTLSSRTSTCTKYDRLPEPYLDEVARLARVRAYELAKEIAPYTEEPIVPPDDFFVLGNQTPQKIKNVAAPDTVMAKSNDVPTLNQRRCYRIPAVGALGQQSHRDIIVDSGASLHIVCKETLTGEERARVRKMGKPVELFTANGLVKATEEVDVRIEMLGNSTITAVLLLSLIHI